MTAPRHIRILTDGKIGDLVQCRGVASHLVEGTDAQLEEQVVRLRGWRSLPWPLPFPPIPAGERPEVPGSPVGALRDGGLPDLVIASGRRTVPYLVALRTWRPAVPIVFLKDPRWQGRAVCDLIWAPLHDRLPPDDNAVVATHTSPHGLTEPVLAAARARAGERLGALEAPVTGVILGGDTGSVRFNARSSHAFAMTLAGALRDRGGSVLVTTSRRTPPVLAGAVRAALPGAWFDDGTENAYTQILAVADELIVTGDSHNMVSEALVTGVPVHVHRPPRLSAKLHRFLDAMVEMGAVRALEAPLVAFEGRKVDASARIARAIRDRLFPG